MKQFKRIIFGFILIVFLLFVLLLYFMSHSLDQAKEVEIKTPINKDKFLILLFPIEDTSLCQRAVLSSIMEYETGTIEVFIDNNIVQIPKDCFTVKPPDKFELYINRLNEEIEKWGKETDWIQIDFDFHLDRDKVDAALIVNDKSGTISKYSYSYTDSQVNPVSIIKKINTGKNLAG